MDQLEVALEGMGINQPYSIEAEQAVLGAAIIDPELVSAIVEQVRSEYFYVKQNRLIFNEILTLFMANTPSDFVYPYPDAVHKFSALHFPKAGLHRQSPV